MGKRLTRIEPISAWDSRALGRADALRRALVADAQLLFPPLAIRNLAWVLRAPALLMLAWLAFTFTIFAMLAMSWRLLQARTSAS